MSRASHLRRWYGITEEQYDELLERQQNCCAICLKDASEFKTRLAVDHDHISGEVRGLLCSYCNRYVLGRHRDSTVLRRMADYIDRGTGWFVPPHAKSGRRRKRKRKLNE